MSVHGIIDTLAVSLGARFMPKYFRDGAESKSVADTLAEVRLELPKMNEEGDYDLVASTPVGDLNAGVRMAQWVGGDAPTVIYHHGASEIPYDFGFKGIFPLHKTTIPANFFLVRALFHRSMKEFQAGIRTLANVTAMLAVSVCLIEHLVRFCRARDVTQVLIAGSSLGGFITNLHHIHFNSADVYTPLLAGLAMDDAYLVSVYRKAVDGHVREHFAERITEVLNFEDDFSRRDHGNVFPLLARYDRLVRFERQRESYGECPVSIIQKGHTTGALAYGQLRRHILEHLGL